MNDASPVRSGGNSITNPNPPGPGPLNNSRVYPDWHKKGTIAGTWFGGAASDIWHPLDPGQYTIPLDGTTIPMAP